MILFSRDNKKYVFPVNVRIAHSLIISEVCLRNNITKQTYLSVHFLNLRNQYNNENIFTY